LGVSEWPENMPKTTGRDAHATNTGWKPVLRRKPVPQFRPRPEVAVVNMRGRAGDG